MYDSFKVSVSDAQSNPRSTEVSVKVELMDVNDNSPQFVHTAPSEFSKYIMGAEIPFYFFQYYATNGKFYLMLVGCVISIS